GRLVALADEQQRLDAPLQLIVGVGSCWLPGSHVDVLGANGDVARLADTELSTLAGGAVQLAGRSVDRHRKGAIFGARDPAAKDNGAAKEVPHGGRLGTQVQVGGGAELLDVA